MKRIRILTGLVTAIFVMVFTASIAFCDIVDDICKDLDYKYRWTIEVELDETYDGTWLAELADNNKLRITNVWLTDPLELEINGKIFKSDGFRIIEGKESGIIDETYAIIKTSVGYEYIYKSDERHPLYGFEPTKEYSMKITHYNLLDNEPKRFAVIEDSKKNCTPIVVEPDEFTQIQDTTLDYLYFRRENLTVQNKYTDYIKAKGIKRENMKQPEVPHEVYWAEYNDINVPDMHYDADIMLEAEESDAVKAISHGNGLRIFRTDGLYTLRVREGFVKDYHYYTSRDIDTFDFTVTVPMELADKEITSDGKINVKLELFNHHLFNLEDVAVLGSDIGLMRKQPKAVVTFKGDLGEKYGFMELPNPTSSSFAVRNHFAGKGEPQNMQEFEDLYLNVPEPDKYDAFAYIYEMFDYDGNVLHVKLEGREDIVRLPKLFLAYYTESGALSDIGLIYDDSQDKIFTVPISEVALNEEAEILLTEGNFKSSKYLATPVVREARAARGPVVPKEEDKEAEDAGLEKEPEPENDEEQTENDEKPSEEDDNSPVKVIINGTEVEFDVEPIIENNRILVPLRVIFEKLGDEVLWNPETGTITVTGSEVLIEFAIDKAEVMVNDEVKTLDAPARVVEERTLVPLRFLSEELGNTVVWDETENTVTIDR